MNRLHPLSAVRTAINYGIIGLTIPFVLGLVLGSIFDWFQPVWGMTLAPVGLILGGLYGIAYYYRYQYAITTDTFDLSYGVYARRSREIPYHRIQNVDSRQSVFHRLFGLAVLSIETAGGGDTEAVLDFVSESDADRLQREIRRRTAIAKRTRERTKGRGVRTDDDRRDTKRAVDDDVDQPTIGETSESTSVPSEEMSVDETAFFDERRRHERTSDEILSEESKRREDEQRRGNGPETTIDDEYVDDRYDDSYEFEDRITLLFDLSSRELLLYAFTSFRPAAVAAVLFVFFFFTDQILAYLLAVSDPVGGPPDLGTGTPSSYLILAIISLINGVAVTYGVSVAYTFATYYDFRLGRTGDDFVYERGLLQRYSGSIPAEKVQSVTVTENPLQRLIGYAGLWVETAGYGPDSSGGSQSAVPLARRSRVHGFTERLTGVETPRFESPSPIALRRYLVRYSLLAGVIVAIGYGASFVTPIERWYVTAIVFAGVPIAAYLRYVHLGYYVGDDHLVIRRGFWKRRTTVVPYYRIQTVTTRRSIFQRRLGLASFVVDTASSRTFSGTTPTVYDVALPDSRAVHNTSRKRLQSSLRKRREDDDGPGISVDFT